MPPVTRREFVRSTALAAVAAQLVSSLRAADTPALEARASSAPRTAGNSGRAELRWLDGKPPAALPGVTWGTPWPRVKYPKDASFALLTPSGESVPLQSWPLATWPDGSLKWTGHAVPANTPASESFELVGGMPAGANGRLGDASLLQALTAKETGDVIEIDTGVMLCRVAKTGNVLIESIARGDREIARAGRLVGLRQSGVEDSSTREEMIGQIGQVTLEQSGPVRAVVKIEGKHTGADGKAWLPFVVRLYFYAGGNAVRMMHTIIYDGDPQTDVIAGLGVRFDVALRGELHDRHVRFSGQDDGLFGEAVRGLTGLRRDPGEAVREAQIAGRATPPIETWAKTVSGRLHYIPTYPDWTLVQPNSDGFEIRKRTKEGFAWLSAARGQRAGGLGYVGSPEGGVAFGLRNFWQSYPAQLDIRGATTEKGEITAWVWSPDSGAMDLRPYHDGMGQDTYDEQLEAMEITYEDYEPGFDTPMGVARTSELYFWALDATPERARLAELAEVVRNPPVLSPTPEYMHGCVVFGGLWSPVDRSTPARVEIEDQLDWYFDFYEGQREQRRWFGYWNYGDVMHTYDFDRHEWRYDIGGFAWDNSELSTDLWLWLHFLRTGRADAFRFAEAMTRHTGEVDVHHLGPFSPLGSRHNVLHWGCSAKQLRISNAANRRYYYYLSADERVGDLMREQIEGARALSMIQANRKVARNRVTAPDPNATEVYAGFGTDWGSLAAAWLTEWERTGDPRMRDRLLASMRSIAAQPRGFFTGAARLNLETGAFAIAESDRVSVSHLSAVFGLVEVCAELIQLFDVPEFKDAWLDYCYYYNAPAAEQEKRFGRSLGGLNLQQGHSRLTAFAAEVREDESLAKRAWQEFYRGSGGVRRGAIEVTRVSGPAVLRPVDEAAGVSTNATAQWGLAAIQCLALVGEALPGE